MTMYNVYLFANEDASQLRQIGDDRGQNALFVVFKKKKKNGGEFKKKSNLYTVFTCADACVAGSKCLVHCEKFPDVRPFSVLSSK